MKHLNLLKSTLLLFALVVGSTSLWANSNVSTVSTKFDATGTVTSKFTQTGDFKNVAWNLGVSWKSNTSWQNLDGTKGAQVGSGSNPATGIVLTGSNIPGTITSVVVNTSGASSVNATVKVTVGGTDFTCGGNKTASLTSSAANYTFTGSGSGDIVITWANSSAKAIYIKSITTTYTPASSSPLDHITLSGTYPTEFYQGDEFSHEGMTVTAHYKDSSTSDVTGSATFTGYNMNTLGDQTVTVSYTEGDITKTANYNITILPAPTAVVTLDFTTNDWGISESPTKTEVATKFTSGGYTITLEGSSGNGYYFDTDNIMLGKSGATLTLPAFGFNVSKIKVYGTSEASSSVTFNVYVGDDAVSTPATSSKVDHEFAIAPGKQNVGTIYVIKVTNANNMRISKIEVYGNGCEAGVVTDAGWATYVTACDMEFAEGDAFVVSAANATTATLTGVTKIRANQPVILKGEGAKTAKVLDEAPAAVSNELAISIGGSINGFVLAKPAGKSAGFYKWNGGSLTSGKVYLPAPAAARDYLEFSFGGETTTINNLTPALSQGEGAWYDLQGRRVAQPAKGLYIVNGKKVFVP